MKLGILDWGIGGLSVLQKIQNEQPDIHGIYFSDSGSTPYGKMNEKQIQERLQKIFDHFIEHEITHIIIACNAASTAFMHLHEYCGRPIINVISPTITAVKNLSFKKVGIIGGNRTVHSELYLKIQDQSQIQVFQNSAQPLSALIEQGKVELCDVQEDIEKILQPLIDNDIEALVLACTHYPALTKAFQELHPHLHLINPADFISPLLPICPHPTGSMEYMTTGSATEMQTAAKKAFQYFIPEIKQIKI